jgi:hypothetical protein
MQRIASVTEWLSIEINVTEEHLINRTFEMNPGHRDMGLPQQKQDEWEP